MVLSEEEKNRHGDTVALAIQDRGTHWLMSYGCSSKGSEQSNKRATNSLMDIQLTFVEMIVQLRVGGIFFLRRYS